jgi:hypothetical protein
MESEEGTALVPSSAKPISAICDKSKAAARSRGNVAELLHAGKLKVLERDTFVPPSSWEEEAFSAGFPAF